MSTTNQRRSSKERFWRQMVRQWRSSGLSIRDFCKDRQISEPSLYAWRRTIAQRDAEAARFVPVQIVAEEKPAVAKDPSSNGLELLLGAGRVLRIGAGFDEATLRRLLALLQEGQP
jgi:transposase-like protein